MGKLIIRHPHLNAIEGICHAVTTRHGPAWGADEIAAAEESCRLLNMRGTAWARQVHGPTVRKVDQPGLAGEADALYTDTPGLLLAGRSADCPIVLIAHADALITGFAHASWRSTVQQITKRLIDRMDTDPRQLYALIAPSAGPCCYEVGPEVKKAALDNLGPDAANYFTDNHHFDLWAANRAQLTEAGIPAQQIATMGICTICQDDDFWSWRRQKEAAGRFAGLIGVQ